MLLDEVLNLERGFSHLDTDGFSLGRRWRKSFDFGASDDWDAGSGECGFGFIGFGRSESARKTGKKEQKR